MRSQKLDALRGLALVLMIAFHANYLLVRLFGDETLDISPRGWYAVGNMSAILFLLVSGVSFFLFAQGRSRQEIVVGTMKRTALLTAVAVGISVVTFLFSPEGGVVFGIIHFFAVSSLLLPIFAPLRKWSVLAGLFVLALGTVFSEVYVEYPFLFFLGLRSTAFSSADYYPIFPWFSVVLIGYGMACFLAEKGEFQRMLA